MYLTAEEMEEQANGLSNYGGGRGYDGRGDDFLQFSGPNGAGSFADPVHQGKIFNLTVSNTSATAALIALLCPGLITTATGLIKDGAFNDTTNTAGLTASGSPGTIAFLNAFIQKFPSQIVGFKISSTNPSQFEQNIVLQKESPFKTHTSKPINVAIYASEANPNTQLITVKETFFMDAQSKISYQILPNTTVTLGLVFGVSLNTAGALRKKTQKAVASKYIG